MSTGKGKQMKQVSKTLVGPAKQVIKVPSQMGSQPGPSALVKGKPVSIPKVPLGGARKSILGGGSFRNTKTIRKLSIKMPNVKQVESGQGVGVEKSKSVQGRQKSIPRIKSKSNTSLRMVKSGPIGLGVSSSEGGLNNPTPPQQAQVGSQPIAEAEPVSLSRPNETPMSLPPSEVSQSEVSEIVAPPSNPGGLSPLPLPPLPSSDSQPPSGLDSGSPIKSSLASMISENFRGNGIDRIKLNMGEVMGKSIAGAARGSLFVIKKQTKRDSTINLLSATIRETESVGKEETEIFIPGKGELRCTLPESDSESTE